MTAVTQKRGSCFSTTTDTTVFTNPRFKVGFVTIGATSTSADTTTVNLRDFGIKRLMAIEGYEHTTENSIIELESTIEESVITVDGDTLTITVNGTSAASKRVYKMYGI